MHAPTIIDFLRLHAVRAQAMPPAPWRPLGGLEIVAADDGLCIVCRSNCALPPGRFVAALALPAVVALLIACAFYFIGAPWVLPFAGLELAALAVAVGLVARNARNRETLMLTTAALQVEILRGGRIERMRFDRAWLQAPRCGADGLIELRGRERSVQVGLPLAAADRAALLRYLRNALNGRPGGAAPVAKV